MNKILKYTGYENITKKSRDAFRVRYFYSVFDESVVNEATIELPGKEPVSEKVRIDVEISGTKAAEWGYHRSNPIRLSLVKILFEYGRRELIDRIEEGAHEPENELLIYSDTHDQCDHDPDAVEMNEGDKYRVAIAEKELS